MRDYAETFKCNGRYSGVQKIFMQISCYRKQDGGAQKFFLHFLASNLVFFLPSTTLVSLRK